MFATQQTIKGRTRQYRKAARRAGLKFPTSGAYHVRDWDNNVVRPADVTANDLVIAGPAPERIEPLPFDGTVTMVPADLPALPECFTRHERVGADASRAAGVKKRVEYKRVANPKPGQRYYVKQSVNGRTKYVEVEFSKLSEVA